MSSCSTEQLPVPILVLPNVIIRPLHQSDAPYMSQHANDLDITAGMRNTFPWPYELHHAECFLANIGLTQTQSSSSAPDAEPVLTQYSICRRVDGVYMGGIGLMPKADVEARTFELGYWIGKEFWGRGYMTEAVTGFVSWTFQTFPELLRLEASVFEGIDGSARVLLKVGFQAEGVRRKAIFKRGHSLDARFYGLLREECGGVYDEKC